MERVLLATDSRLDRLLVWQLLSSVPVDRKGTAFAFHRYSSCLLRVGRDGLLTARGLGCTIPSHVCGETAISPIIFSLT